MDSEYAECFELLINTLPRVVGDGHTQVGQLLYNPTFDRVEICSTEGGWIGFYRSGKLEGDVAPFAG